MQRIARRSLFSLALALGLTAACGACTKKGDEIVVGAYLSLTGKDSSFGIDTKNGIDLAVEQVNAAGGIKGKKVKVVYEDDKSTQAEATLKVQQLIDRDGAVAILGEVASNRSLAGGLVANNKKVPMVTPSSTAVEVTKGRDWVFRTCFTDAQQGDVAARFVRENLKKTSVSVFYVAQDAYSSGLAQSFKETFEKLGGKIILSKGFQDGETNFTTYLNELRSGNPEIIFAPVYYNSMAVIARQAKQVGLEGSKFVGGDGWDSSELLEGAGAELEGAYFTNHYAPDVPWENSKQFISAYKTKHTREPNSLAAQGYDAARLLFDAMGRAPEPKPEAIRAALVDTKDFKGATGTMTIDKDRNANKPIVVVQIKDKKFTYSTELKSGS
jgi:branched-chain amino acid transport system substrate-binding protein